MKQQNYIKDILVKSPKKAVKKVVNSKQCRLRNFATYEIMQVAKIRNTAKLLQCSSSPLALSSNCLLTCSYSFEFDSDSLYLSRLDDDGAIGLQNYKDNHKI